MSQKSRMPKSVRSAVAAGVAFAACGLLVGRGLDSSRSAAGRPSGDYGKTGRRGKLRWYRGNLHTHSLWSDGDDYLEMIGLWYKDHGYDFLCFTDHNRARHFARCGSTSTQSSRSEGRSKSSKARFPTDWVEERTVDGKQQVRLKTFEEVRRPHCRARRFLLIQGEEISDLFGRLAPIHINASNVQEAFRRCTAEAWPTRFRTTSTPSIAQRERTGKPILVHLNHPELLLRRHRRGPDADPRRQFFRGL